MTASSQAATRRSRAITRSPEPDRALEREDFLGAERPELAARQAPERERPERDALEAPDLDADAREEATDLAVLPLGQRHRHEREVAAPPVPRLVFLVPVLWAAVGSVAAFSLGVVEDFGLLAAGIVALAALLATPR